MFVRIACSLPLAICVILAQALPTRADIVVTNDPSVEHDVDQIDDHQVTGNEMSGMIVSVKFADSSTDSAVWAAGAGSFGSASSTDWSLSLNGDSFGENWQLSNTSGMDIVGFHINAQIAGVVFDIFLDDSIGTEDSRKGAPFYASSDDDGMTGTATYSHAISTINNHGGVHQGDLFGILDVVITQGGIASSQVETFGFRADTDIISQAVPEASQVIVLSLIGAACGMCMWRRRRLALATAAA